mmetsp:Transcript_3608/g.7490  ORF Transcript_3608/g.7490 Transcript_3608/m.7490 type:complete len:276 (-) Transcript_3608:741-1568(-)
MNRAPSPPFSHSEVKADVEADAASAVLALVHRLPAPALRGLAAVKRRRLRPARRPRLLPAGHERRLGRHPPRLGVEREERVHRVGRDPRRPEHKVEEPALLPPPVLHHLPQLVPRVPPRGRERLRVVHRQRVEVAHEGHRRVHRRQLKPRNDVISLIYHHREITRAPVFFECLVELLHYIRQQLARRDGRALVRPPAQQKGAMQHARFSDPLHTALLVLGGRIRVIHVRVFELFVIPRVLMLERLGARARYERLARHLIHLRLCHTPLLPLQVLL